MTYENVHTPPKISDTDPKATVERKPEDVVAVQNEVIKARARRELVQEQQLTDNILNPPQAEPPFKVTGGINLGTIDLQEQQRLAREEAAIERKEAQLNLESLRKERDEARNALNNASLEHLKDGLMTQIDSLKGAIANGQKPTNFFQELENIENAAAKLGFAKAESAGTADFNGQLSLKRLEQEMKREDRRFALEMKNDERKWQLELKKLDQASRESQARLEGEQQKYAMLASIPEQFGSAFAKGIMDKGKTGGGGIAQQPQTETRQVPAITVEAGPGESGEMACPKCKSQVGIGPTTTQTLCAGCNQPFYIKRVAQQAGA